jgi:undecaprenyl-diphosphatase
MIITACPMAPPWTDSHEPVPTTATQRKRMLEYVEGLDHQFFFALNNGLARLAFAPALDGLFWLWATVGNGTGLLGCALIGLWCFDRSALKRHWGWLTLSVLAGGAIMQALKYGIARPRPLITFAPMLAAGEVYIHVVGEALQYRSFPSGHAQAAASVFTYLWFLYPRQAVWWGLGMVLAALGRIYVGAHFPADVLVGACLGSLSTCGVVVVQRRWARRQGSEAQL